jgi:hypothetical protein
MDPFTIVTGALTCVATAELLYKCSKYLRETRKISKRAEKDINFFANTVHIFSGLIVNAGASLRKYAKSLDHPNLNTFQYLLERGVLRMMVEQVESILWDVETYVPILKTIGTMPGVVVKFQMIYRRKEIKTIFLRIDTVTNSFLLVMLCIQLEVLFHQPRSEGSGKEMLV